MKRALPNKSTVDTFLFFPRLSCTVLSLWTNFPRTATARRKWRQLSDFVRLFSLLNSMTPFIRIYETSVFADEFLDAKTKFFPYKITMRKKQLVILYEIHNEAFSRFLLLSTFSVSINNCRDLY